MKVKNLINKLKQCNPDLDVEVFVTYKKYDFSSNELITEITSGEIHEVLDGGDLIGINCFGEGFKNKKGE